MRILAPQQDTANLTDPSLLHRPEAAFKNWKDEKRINKKQEEFRNYEDNLQTEVVRKTYKEMHTKQTVAFVKAKIAEWTQFNHAEMTMMEAVFMLDKLIDESDPDTDLPNSMHAFQTAERIRQKYPDQDWFHLTGLIHDVGKLMALWGEPQWAVVGDTFPVGCQFQKSCVFYDAFMDNPDWNDARYNTLLGIYEEHCGLENVLVSWGHDEYIYRVLEHNKASLPQEALYAVRFHSLYPYHAAGSYQHLANEQDRKMFHWLKELNGFDLYSKSDAVPDPEALRPYYQSLIDKYIPGVLQW